MEESDRQAMFDLAALGREVDAFWGSRMGEYLLTRCDREYVTALEQLKTCDPTNSTLIIRLQGEVWRAQSFRGWLEEAIRTGLSAENLLEERDNGS